MPVLPNPKHELFAQHLAKGETSDAAYVLAGYEENRGNATRLKANESVQVRLMELQGRAAEKTMVTVETLLLEAEEARVGATAAGQFNAVVAAIKEKGVLSGARVERKEVGQPGEFDHLTDDEVRSVAERSARLLLENSGREPPPAGENGHNSVH